MNDLGPYSIGIDVGSSNVKAVVVDVDGRQVAHASTQLSWGRRGDVAELDAHHLWEAVVSAVSRAVGEVGPDVAARIGSVGACGQYSSIVPVDDAIEPLAPMRLYLDQRGTSHCVEIMGRHPEAFETWLERHPIPPIGGGLALGHLLSLAADDPGNHARTAAYLEPVDYVTARLTGRVTATQASMFASQLIDNRELGVTTYDAELCAMAGVDAAKLPPLVAPDSVVGEVSSAVATQIGLGSGVVVRAGLTDTHAAALATGADSGARLGVAIGTTGVVLATTEHLAIDLDHEILAMPGVRPNERLVWAENGLAGRAVEQGLSLLSEPADGGDLFDGFDQALVDSAPGAGGLVFMPWLSGSLSPQADMRMRGGFVGLSLESNRADAIRSMVEGVSHNLRWLIGHVSEFTGRTPSEIILTGGGARSVATAQVVSDVTQLPVSVLAEPSFAGARAAASWGASPERFSVDDGPGLGGRPSMRLEPDPALAGRYADDNGRYVALFDALRPWYAEG